MKYLVDHESGETGAAAGGASEGFNAKASLPNPNLARAADGTMVIDFDERHPPSGALSPVLADNYPLNGRT